MTLTSAPVPASTSFFQRLLADHAEKLVRYFGVSVVNVVLGQGILAICLAVLDMGAVPSQFTSAMISAVPAYVLSRRWVWRQSGPDSFRTEVLPFLVMAVIGLVFAASMIALVSRSTDSTIVLMATSLGSYGVVWVAKYVVLDKLMWKVTHHGDDPTQVAAESV